MKQIIKAEIMAALTIAQLTGLFFFEQGGFLGMGISLAAIYFGIIGIHKEMTEEKKNKKWITAYWIFTIGSAVTLVINSVAMWELFWSYIASA